MNHQPARLTGRPAPATYVVDLPTDGEIRATLANRRRSATDILGPQTDESADPNDPETRQDPDAWRDRHDPER